MNPETKIMREISDYLNKENIFHFRINADATTVGLPDIMVCYKGRMVALEVKTPTGKPTDIQKRVVEEIVKCGGFGGFPTNVEDVKNILKKVDLEEQWQR